MRALLTEGSLLRSEVRDLFEQKNTTSTPDMLSSVERMLTLDFFNARRRKELGNIALIRIEGDVITLDPSFSGLYHAYVDSGDRDYNAQSFKAHVDDILETSLYLNRAEHSWDGNLVVGNRYSRKDVCRLLLWESNQESTIYGYKIDKMTSTCPIFVTYDKNPEVSASTKYQDAFHGPSMMKWYSRSGRTLQSAELQPIINHGVPLFLFVKKSDAEGNEFYYLGTAESRDAEQTTMPGESERDHNVVTMGLKLDSPVEQGLYDYLVDSGRVPS